MTETESGILLPDALELGGELAAITAGGLKLPYPAPTDPVAQGAAAIQSLAQALEADLLALPMVVAAAIGDRSTGNYGFQSTGQYGFLPWKDVKAKGLRYQLRLMGEFWSNQANQYAQMQVQYNAGIPANTIQAGGTLWTSAITAATSPVLQDSGWITLDPPAAWDTWDIIRFAIFTSADNTGQSTTSRLNLLARIISP
jgi:hypothetical protein